MPYQFPKPSRDELGDVEFRLGRDETLVSLSAEWSTYLPTLMKIISITSGNILELGTGMLSTPYLHWVASSTDRKVASYDNSDFFLSATKHFVDDFHDVFKVDSYMEVPTDQNWDVVLIDFFPVDDRMAVAQMLSERAKYIIVHDTSLTDGEGLFQYRYDDTRFPPNTTVFSNLVDLGTLTN